MMSNSGSISVDEDTEGRPEERDQLAKARLVAGSQIVPAVADAAKRHGYEIYPSAQPYLKKLVKRSESVGTIKGSKEKLKVAIVFTAAGVEIAKKKGKKTVTVKDLREGWERYVRHGSGNCPPQRCVKRSVVERKDEELQEKIPTLSKISIRAKS